jgi:hypothetical protein
MADAWLVIRCAEQGSEVIGRYETECEAAGQAALTVHGPKEVVFHAPARRLASRILDTEGE